MNPWFGKAAFIVSLISMMLIRAPHGIRSGQVKIEKSRKGRLEVALLALMSIATLILPVISIASPLLSFADYGLGVLPFFLEVLVRRWDCGSFTALTLILGSTGRSVWQYARNINLSQAACMSGFVIPCIRLFFYWPWRRLFSCQTGLPGRSVCWHFS